MLLLQLEVWLVAACRTGMAHSGRHILPICMAVLFASLLLASCELSSQMTEPAPSITPLAPGSTASSPSVEPTLTSSLPPPSTSAPIVNRTTHGRIGWNETWRREIRITGDIIVERGFTLTIAPGTKVLVAANSDMENLNTDPFEMQKGIRQEKPGEDPFYRGVHFGEPFRDEGNHTSIRIMGTLHAVGTPTQVITITSSSETPSIYDWNYFQFDKGTMSYCRLEYYRCLNPGNDTTITYNSLLNVGEAGDYVKLHYIFGSPYYLVLDGTVQFNEQRAITSHSDYEVTMKLRLCLGF